MTEDDALAGAAPVVDGGFRPLLEKLSTTYNFDFREYKEPSLARRIRARMSPVYAATFEDYSSFLDQHADEHVVLFNTVLVNVTAFFRDPAAWSALASEVMPRLVAEAAESRSIRIWCAGCSSGEETYSVTMLLAEQLGDTANVLIYFTAELQERVLSRFHYAIRAGGYLFLGRSESLLPRSRLFSPLQPKWRIFQRLPTAAHDASAVLPDRAGMERQPTERPAPSESLPASSAHRAIEALPMALNETATPLTRSHASW